MQDVKNNFITHLGLQKKLTREQIKALLLQLSNEALYRVFNEKTPKLLSEEASKKYKKANTYSNFDKALLWIKKNHPEIEIEKLISSTVLEVRQEFIKAYQNKKK